MCCGCGVCTYDLPVQGPKLWSPHPRVKVLISKGSQSTMLNLHILNRRFHGLGCTFPRGFHAANLNVVLIGSTSTAFLTESATSAPKNLYTGSLHSKSQFHDLRHWDCPQFNSCRCWKNLFLQRCQRQVTHSILKYGLEAMRHKINFIEHQSYAGKAEHDLEVIAQWARVFHLCFLAS